MTGAADWSEPAEAEVLLARAKSMGEIKRSVEKRLPG